jgi:thiol-disulfide isomerase/thioredoxin
MVAPELERVARDTAGRFLVVKVNTDQVTDIAARFRISSIPTIAVVWQDVSSIARRERASRGHPCVRRTRRRRPRTARVLSTLPVAFDSWLAALDEAPPRRLAHSRSYRAHCAPSPLHTSTSPQVSAGADP